MTQQIKLTPAPPDTGEQLTMPVFTWRDSNNGHDYETTEPDILFPRVSPDGIQVAFKNHDDGAALIDGIPRAPMIPTYGNSPVCWHPNGTVYIQTDESGILTTIAPDGTRSTVDLRQSHAQYLPFATGIHHIEPDGRVVLVAELPHAIIQTVSGPVECWNLSSDTDGSGRQIALSNGGGPAGCVVLLEPGQVPQMWVPPFDIQTPPSISCGRPAVSGYDTLAPDAMLAALVPFVKWEPPLIVPEHARLVPRIAYGDPYLPTANTTLIIQGAKFLTAEEKKHPERVIIVLPRPNDDPSPTRVADAIAMAKEIGAPVGLYDDNYAWDLCRPDWAALGAANVGRLFLQQCYPRPTLAEDIENFPVAEFGKPLLVEQCRRNYPLPVLTEADTIINAAVERGLSRGVAYFGWSQAEPKFKAHIDAYCLATPNPDLSWLPKTAKPVPPVVVPPPVKPPKPPKNHGAGQEHKPSIFSGKQ